MDTINKRRSIRNILIRNRTRSLEKIVRAGMQAPSAINQQPCIFCNKRQR